MHLCLFEDAHLPALRPLVETRAAYDLRLGGRTILETARDAFAPDGLVLHARPLVADVTRRDHPSALVNTLPGGADVLFVNGRFVAERDATQTRVARLPEAENPRVLVEDDTIVAAWVPDAAARLPNDLLDRRAVPSDAFSHMAMRETDDATLVGRPWDLLDTLRPALGRDIEAQTDGPRSTSLVARAHATVHDSVGGIHDDRIYLGEGATIKPGAILNAEDGPIYLGPNATVHEQAVVRGPCVIGPKTHVKIGANIEGTATGTWCKIAGEVHDTILQGFSNKGHPGFLGHSVLGCWCNLGADTNNSNLRNDYRNVTAYAPSDGEFVSTGRQFAGLFMGDHTKCGINTMLDTGTVVGTCCNLYGAGLPPRYVPPFSWGGARTGFSTYRLEKALSVAERVMGRRDVPFTEAHAALLSALHERTADERAAHHG